VYSDDASPNKTAACNYLWMSGRLCAYVGGWVSEYVGEWVSEYVGG